ncbi:MAG: TatD family hydrolase [Bacteroidales bacterium]
MLQTENIYVNFHAHQHKPGADEIVIQSLFLQENLIVNLNDKIFFTSGLHPWHADQLITSEIEKRLENLISKKQIIAIGETGLDKIRGADWKTQIDVFKTHIIIAEKHNLPLIIHSVKSHNEVLKLKIDLNSKLPWVIHNFTGSEQIAKDLIHHGFYLSLCHHIQNSNSRISEYFQTLPIDRIFFETDDFNVGIKGLYHTAAIKFGISIEELKKQISKNIESLFKRES